MLRPNWFKPSVIFALFLIVPIEYCCSAEAIFSTKSAMDAERRVLDTKLANDERECSSRFAVNDCVVAARREYQQRLRELQGRQNALSRKEREQRAIEQRETFAASAKARAGAQAERAAEGASAGGKLAASPSTKSASGRSTGSVKAVRAAKPARAPKANKKAVKPAPNANVALEKQRAFDKKQLEIAAHRAAIEKKKALPSNKTKAKPLPVPVFEPVPAQ